MRILFLSGLATFLLDQLSKYAVVHGLDLRNTPGGHIPVFPPFLEFKMAWNKGVNFGLFSSYDMRWVLIILSLVICVGIVIWAWRSNLSRLAHVFAGFLVGGALGNVIDRFVYGAVADFLNMSCCGIYNPFAFNVADVAIFIGAFGLIIFSEDKA